MECDRFLKLDGTCSRRPYRTHSTESYGERCSSYGLLPLEEELVPSAHNGKEVKVTINRPRSDRCRRTLRASSIDLGFLISQRRHKIPESTPKTSPNCESILKPLGTSVTPMADDKYQLSYTDLIPGDQEKVKEHLQRTMQLATIISDFVSEYALLYETFSNKLQELASIYKQKTFDCTNENEGAAQGQSSMLAAWEAVLSEVITDSLSYGELSGKLKKSKCSRLAEVAQCKTLHMNEMYKFRKRLDVALDQSEEMLHKLRVELRDETHAYKMHHQHYMVDGSERKDRAFQSCANAHNNYVLQLKSTNKLIEEYHSSALPWIYDELGDVHSETCNAMNSTMKNLSLFLVSKAHDQANRYDGLFRLFKQVSPAGDVHNFVKPLQKDSSPDAASFMPKPHVFVAILDNSFEVKCLKKAEVIFNDLVNESTEAKLTQLRWKKAELEEVISQLSESVLSLENSKERLLESNNFDQLYNNQLEICNLGAQLHQAKISHCVIGTQIKSLTPDSQPDSEPSELRRGKTTKFEGGIKTMWKKFAKKAARRKDDNASKVSQGNGLSGTVHDAGIDIGPEGADEQVDEANADPVYNLLKGASMLRGGGDGESSGVSSMRSLPRQNTASSGRSGSSRSSSPAISSYQPAMTSVRPKQMLNRRMKSFSLDTPDAPKQVDQSTKRKSSSYTNNTCIPGANLTPEMSRRRHIMSLQRRGLSAEEQDGGSLLNDSNPSVHSSHSNSPRGSRGKPPLSSSAANDSEGYHAGDTVIALIDIDANDIGDLNLRSGDRISLKDTSDAEWWSGSSSGYTGFFRSRYVMAVADGQLIYKIVKPIYLSDDNSEVKLLRYQVVVGEGWADQSKINIHTKDVKTGKSYRLQCPWRYLERIGES